MSNVRRSARSILFGSAIVGLAALGGCARTDLTSPAPQKPAFPTASHDDTPCSTGWIVVDGRLVCNGT